MYTCSHSSDSCLRCRISEQLDSLVDDVVACVKYLRRPDKPLCDFGSCLFQYKSCLWQTVLPITVVVLCLDALLRKMESRGNDLVQTFSDVLDRRVEQTLRSKLKKGVTTSLKQHETTLRNWCKKHKVYYCCLCFFAASVVMGKVVCLRAVAAMQCSVRLCVGVVSTKRQARVAVSKSI